jgi:hypothetical protein
MHSITFWIKDGVIILFAIMIVAMICIAIGAGEANKKIDILQDEDDAAQEQWLAENYGKTKN